MNLIPEYVLLHEALAEVGSDLQRAYLRDAVLRDGVIRNLRKGSWYKALLKRQRLITPLVREVIETLRKNRRLLPFEDMLPTEPACDADWCAEAIASHGKRILNGIIASKEVALGFSGSHLPIISMATLHEAQLHDQSQNSVTTSFKTSEYLQVLSLPLASGDYLRFLDPYIDPENDHYKSSFLELLIKAGTRSPRPKIEVHRKAEYTHPGKELKFKTAEEWRPKFEAWHRELEEKNIPVRVVIWDKFHDRYFLSRLLALSVSNGFKTNRDLNDLNTWTRLDHKTLNVIERQFDLNNSPSLTRHCDFMIGVKSA